MELFESVEQLWALIGIIGGGVFVNTITFIKTALANRNISKVKDFSVVAKKAFDHAKTEITESKDEVIDLKNQIINEIKEEIVKPLLADNKKLTDIAVSTLSLVNVPLDSKKQFFEVLSGISSVSKQAKDLLAQSIANDEKIAEEEEQQNQDTADNIDGI